MGARPEYAHAAESVGRLIAARGLSLVYGGGLVGLMGRCASACLQAGGRVVGVLPRFMAGRELPNHQASQLLMVDSMHQRKALMAAHSRAVLVLPGGAGTLDELFETLTWNQLGLQNKPIGLLNISGYFDALMDLLRQAEVEGFLPSSTLESIDVDPDPAPLLDRLLRATQTA